MNTDYLELTAIFLILIFGFVYAHEKTHQSIYKDYGCEDITIDFVPNQENLATTSARCPQDAYPEVNQAQQQVEATGYQLTPVYLLLTTFYILYIYDTRYYND